MFIVSHLRVTPDPGYPTLLASEGTSSQMHIPEYRHRDTHTTAHNKNLFFKKKSCACWHGVIYNVLIILALVVERVLSPPQASLAIQISLTGQ